MNKAADVMVKRGQRGLKMITAIVSVTMVLAIALGFEKWKTLESTIVDLFPISQAVNSKFTLVALSGNVGISLPALAEALSYYLFDEAKDFKGHKVHIDRAILSLMVIIPNLLILCFIEKPFASFLFASTHAFQYVTAFGIVLGQSNLVYPDVFTSKRCTYFLTMFSLAGLNAIYGFGLPPLHWSNLLPFVFVFLTFAPYYFVVYKWFPSALKLALQQEKEDEIVTCMYITFFTMSIVIFPGVLAGVKLFNWIDFDMITVLGFIYSYGCFCILLTSISGFLLRKEQAAANQAVLAMKSTLIRFFSHEVRTPLNIISSTIGFLEDTLLSSSMYV